MNTPASPAPDDWYVAGPGSFDAMYAREFVPVVRLLAAMTGRVDVAEELAQDVFVTTHNRWDEIRD